MSRWRERVVAAAADWVYLPDDAQRHVTDEYALVGYADAASPTSRVSSRRVDT